MSKIATRSLARLCHRVGTSLKAGVDVQTVWATEARSGPPPYREQLDEVRRRVSQGTSIADALRESDGYFPPLACDLVEVGEQTGKVDDVFLRLAAHYDHVLALRKQFLTGIAWPGMQLVGAIFIVGLLIAVMGILGDRENPIQILPGITASPEGLSTYITIVLFAASGVGMAVLSFQKGWVGSAPVVIAMKIPMIGGAFRTIALSRFAWSLSMALDSGVDAVRTIRLALRTTQNPVFTELADSVGELIQRGDQFHEALRETDVFPDEFLDAVEVAEVAGTQSESMMRLAQDYDDRSRQATKILTAAASFAVWAGVGALIVFMIFNLFYQVYLKPMQDLLDGF